MKPSYSSRVVAQARSLSKAGWAPGDICNILHKETGRRPVLETVKCWVDDDYAEKRRRAFASQKRKERRARGVTWLPQCANTDTKCYRMRVLRDAGLTHNAIAAVMRLDYGVEISGAQVRYSFNTGSIPRCLREAA
jgi:hypothetical protein